MRLLVRAAIAVLVLGTWLSPAAAQESLTKQDRQGPVTVDVTLMAPATAGEPLRVKVVLDTHSAALDGVAFEDAVVLRTPGADVAPTAVEGAKGSGHHREAMLAFPSAGAGVQVRIVVKNVGGVKERIFAWDLPAPR